MNSQILKEQLKLCAFVSQTAAKGNVVVKELAGVGVILCDTGTRIAALSLWKLDQSKYNRSSPESGQFSLNGVPTEE